MKKQAACCNRCQLIQVVARDKHGLPCSRFNRPIRVHMLSMPSGSNPFAGSSKISRSVSPNKAVAISSRRFIPREKLPTLFSHRCPARLGPRREEPHVSHRAPFRTSDPKILSRTEGLVCSAGIWHIADTRPHQAQLFFDLPPKSSTLPDDGSQRPNTILISVLLPARLHQQGRRAQTDVPRRKRHAKRGASHSALTPLIALSLIRSLASRSA